MRILTLAVNDSVADGYNSAPPQEKKKINSAINMVLEKFLKKGQDAALLNAIDDLSVDSTQSGLTIEKLGELMEWDAETMKNLFGDDYPKTNG